MGIKKAPREALKKSLVQLLLEFGCPGQKWKVGKAKENSLYFADFTTVRFLTWAPKGVWGTSLAPKARVFAVPLVPDLGENDQSYLRCDAAYAELHNGRCRGRELA